MDNEISTKNDCLIEKDLQSQKDELQIIFDSVPAWIFYKDKENRFIKINEPFAKVMKLPKESVEGKTCWDLFSKEQAERIALG